MKEATPMLVMDDYEATKRIKTTAEGQGTVINLAAKVKIKSI